MTETAAVKRLPWQPLEDLLVARLGPPSRKRSAKRGNSTGATISNMARELHTSAGGIQNWQRRGTMTIRSADRCAIALGMHPVEIWGDAWLTDTTRGRG